MSLIKSPANGVVIKRKISDGNDNEDENKDNNGNDNGNSKSENNVY